MKILVVSVHPDDETLGAGASLLKYKAEGHQTHWLNITDIKEDYGYAEALVNMRAKQIEAVRKLYAFDSFVNLGFQPTCLDKMSMNALIGPISKVVGQIEPEVILIPNGSDIHSDHQVVYKALLAASKTFRYPFIKKILCMEVVSETDFDLSYGFKPNYFVDVSAYMAQKIEIMSIYESEVAKHPFPRSLKNLEALGIRRGSMANVEYAEAFMALKIIE